MKNVTKEELELLRQAYRAQDASNLSGIVHSFSRAITKLRELHPDKGTNFLNGHPVCVLYSDKIMQLSKAGNPLILSDSFALARQAMDIQN